MVVGGVNFAFFSFITPFFLEGALFFSLFGRSLKVK